ncbi:MAG: lysylphosphatidylglycerol synthase domain-containing protein [Kiloniellales bacterium]
MRTWAHRNRRGLRRIALWVSVAVLLAGLVISMQAQPDVLTGLDWRYLLLVMLLGVPLMVALNAMEFLLTGRLLGRRIRIVDALEITVVGTAANMLPLPGGVLVRLAGLKAAGARFGQGVAASFLIFFVAAGIAAVYSGLWISCLDSTWAGPVIAVSGGLLLLLSAVAAMRLEGGFPALTIIAATRLGLVLVTASRIYLCFLALGIPASFAQASGLSVSGVMSSVVAFVPAGLGVRELIAAALSPLVGLAMSSGFMVTFINRLLTIIVVIPIAIFLNLRRSDELAVQRAPDRIWDLR